MKDKSITINVGLLGVVLFLVFLALKIFNVVTWSWWWVTAPLWLPVVASLIIIVAVFSYFKKTGVCIYTKMNNNIQKRAD